MIRDNWLFADLHLHSRFSRACSKELNLDNLVKWARIKGLNLLGTGDFSHPEWFKEIKEKLKPNGKGLYSYQGFDFIVTGELSFIYTHNGKGRKVHLNLLIPSLEVAEKIHEYLDTKGRRDYDGRPIFGIPCEKFVFDMMKISKDIEIIPAHIWTPYFGVFGSMSGFDSLEEAFGNQVENIHSIETGISSDRKMNNRIKEFSEKKISIVSFSDSHCVAPDSLITLDDGYVLPISEIKRESSLICANFSRNSSEIGNKFQLSKIPSPRTLKKIKYYGGEIQVSDKHIFFVFENGRAVEKFAGELKKGDLIFRLVKANHKIRKKILLKKPNIKIYYSLSQEGMKFIKRLRKERNFLQKEVAENLKIFKNHYWKIEKGLVKIEKSYLKNLSSLWGFDFEKFIEKYTLEKYFDFKFPDKTSIELFEILGYLMGDGCLSIRNNGKCLLFSDKNKDILNYYKVLIEDLFSCKCRISEYSYQNSFELFIPSHVAQFFEINFSESVLKTNKLRIPRKVFSSSLRKIAGFLRGFFDAEGCVGHHHVDFCSSNKLLFSQVDSLLKKFGLFTTLSFNQLEKTKQKYRHRLYLHGDSLRRFYEKINFNHPSKKIKLEKYVDSLKVLRKSKIKRLGDFALVEVQSTEDVKSNYNYLYDVAVNKYKNYIANQVIVHNSFWPWRLGREATIFKKTDSYFELIRQIRENDFIGTIETEPAYGKYHWDGHMKCGFSCSPRETGNLGGICPKCGRPLTIGVENRVEKLADDFEINKDGKLELKILPLHEIISLFLNVGINSKAVWNLYNSLIEKFKNEFNILLDICKEDFLKEEINENLIGLILKNREGKINVQPGYDGEYGKALVGLPREKQGKLF